MTQRPHNWHIRGTHCKRCNAPKGDKGPCRGGMKHGKAKEAQKRREKHKRKPKDHNYRRSRFVVGQRVWCIPREREGVVVSHVRRRKRTGDHILWRQCPVVRFENPVAQAVYDDTELARHGNITDSGTG